MKDGAGFLAGTSFTQSYSPNELIEALSRFVKKRRTWHKALNVLQDIAWRVYDSQKSIRQEQLKKMNLDVDLCELMGTSEKTFKHRFLLNYLSKPDSAKMSFLRQHFNLYTARYEDLIKNDVIPVLSKK